MPEIDRRQLAAYAALAVLVLLVGARYLRSQSRLASTQPAVATKPSGGATVALDRAPGHDASLVHVAGAVARAGGATAKGDPNAINLAAKVADGQQVVVPRRGGAPAAGVDGGAVPGA